MMQSESNKLPQENNVSYACWSCIGVQGDRSCPRLTQAIHCRNCPVFSAAGQQLFQRVAPPEYLVDWTQRIAESDAITATEELSVLIFRIGAEWLAFDTRSVVEVVELRPMHRVPHRTDRLLLGLANIRGELHLCVSLRELLGIEEVLEDRQINSVLPTITKERLLVVAQDQNRWVFPVDEVEGVCRIKAHVLENLPHTVEKSPKSYSQAIFSHQNKKVGMLTESRIFQALEKTIR
jgi:chemotaxis-related protein WspD